MIRDHFKESVSCCLSHRLALSLKVRTFFKNIYLTNTQIQRLWYQNRDLIRQNFLSMLCVVCYVACEAGVLKLPWEWSYWTLLSHFGLMCESFSSPCWFRSLACQLNCSEHGRCDSFTKRCVCDPFWMENLIRVQMGDGESNCGTSNLPGVHL